MWRFYELLMDGYDFRGKRVLEMGCGTGINTILMAKRGAKVTFMDFSRDALNIVKRNMEIAGVDGEFVLGDILDVDFDLTCKCCDFLKKKPLKSVTKNGTIIGTMATDSYLRKFSYMKTGCINDKDKKCMPLSIWTKKDILEFIRKYNISYSEIYDKGETNTGCAYCGFGIQYDRDRFKRLQLLESKRFAKIMNVKNNNIRRQFFLE